VIKRLVWLVLVLIILSPSPAALAAEPGGGVIEGQVVNGTAGGSSVANLEVTLQVYQGGTQVDTATALTDASGRFSFEGLATEPDYSYQVVLTFQQAEYSTGALSFGDGETTKYAEVTVYDATTSDEAVKVEMAHTVIYVEPDGLRVEEYALVANDSDRTYIGAREITDGVRETLRFSLPDKAVELQVRRGLMECCVYGSEDGFVDTMPLLPGKRELVYSYRISDSSKEYTFSRRVYYPTGNYDLLVQGENVEVASDQLAVAEPLFISDIWFKHLSGNDLAAGDVLVARFSNLRPASTQSAILWVVLALVVLTGGFGLAYYVSRRRHLQPAVIEDDLSQQKQRLLLELSQLDDDFEDGKIDAKSYRRLRAEKKSQLLFLVQKEKSGSGS
jgi:hypothetical protein